MGLSTRDLAIIEDKINREAERLSRIVKCELASLCANYPSLKCLNCIYNKRKFKYERNNVRQDHFTPFNDSCPLGGRCEG